MINNQIKAFLLVALFLCSHVCFADTYPTRPIKIVVGFSPGGGPDITARAIGQKLSESWSQGVIVENKLGAGSNIASQFVANSAPDGYTLLSVSSAFAISPAIYSKLPFDASKDFSGVTLTATGPAFLIVSPNLKVNNVEELIALAKQQPGGLTYSSAGVGSGSHFAAELLRVKTGVEFLHVPTKGIPEGLTEVVSGRVDFFISPYASAVAMVRDGRAKAIAVTSTSRIKDFPGLPSVAEAISGYKWEFWYGLLAPAKTPKPILQKIALEVKRINDLPDIKERYASLGIQPISSSPEAFDKMLSTEISEFTRLAALAKIKAE